MSNDWCYDQIISEIEEMGEEEFSDFARYHNRAAGSFIQANFEVADEVRENAKKLSKAGGNAFVLGRMSAMLNRSQGPKDYSAQLREYRENSENKEIIENTVEEILSGFFSEDQDLKYELE